MLYAFGDYTLDPARYELRRAGVLVPMEPRVFDLLAYLVQHAGQTVSKEELFVQLWAEQFVTDSALTYCVTGVRKAIGDSGRGQRYIRTVHSRGYRFIVPVAMQQETEAEAPPPEAPQPPPPTEVPSLAQADTAVSLPAVRPAPPAALSPTPEPASPPAAGVPAVPAAEWRQLTVLACHLVYEPTPAAPLDSEVRLAVLRAYRQCCAAVLHRFGGALPQYDGLGLVAYFGYPQAHEDAARRAVFASLGLVAEVAALSRRAQRDWGVSLAVQVGMHTGREVVGSMALGSQGEPLMLGDIQTVATHLRDCAPPDMVLISQATFRLVEGDFACAALGTHLLEERTDPLVVYQVLHASSPQQRRDVTRPQGLTPFVGREPEVGLLHEAWTQATEGLGQVVVLRGEAGIGKSRLMQVFTAQLTEAVYTRLECHCSPYSQHTAFYPVVSALQQFLHFRPEDTAEAQLHHVAGLLERAGLAVDEQMSLWAALLGLPLPAHYPPAPSSPQLLRQQTLDAVLAWLLKEAERQPVCVTVEDCHWADASTLEWLTLLLDQVPTARLLVLLVCRPEFALPWAARAHLAQIGLRRLSRPHVEAMVEQLTGHKRLPAEVLEYLVATTDGVPLFVEELTRLVLESGLLKERQGRYELVGPLAALAIPATLHDALMARLDRLGPAKQIAQLGATIGRDFSYAVLQAVAGEEETVLHQRLAQLVEAELLYQRGRLPQATYTFKHALIQDAVYQSLLKSTRQQYHQRIAQVLATQFAALVETQPELLAHHYTAAGLHEPAVVYWQRAGERAVERSAYQEAISHFTHGIEALQTLPVTPERVRCELALHIALGMPLQVTRGYTAPEVRHVYTRARELCQQVGDMPQVFPALWGLWRFYLAGGDARTAHELAEQCFSLAQHAQDTGLLIEAHQMLGISLYRLGELVPALAHFEHGLALYTPQHHNLAFLYGEDPGVVFLGRAAVAQWDLGYPDQALQGCHAALTLARELSHPYSLGYALCWIFRVPQGRREAHTVAEWAEELIALSAMHGFAQALMCGKIIRGWALGAQGQIEEGIAQLHQGLMALRALGVKTAVPSFLTLFAEAYGACGQVAEGLCQLTEALAVIHNTGERFYEAEVYRVKGELLLRQAVSDVLQAEACFQQALTIARRQQAKSWELRAATSLARLWQQQGKQTAARALLAPIYGWFTEGFDTADLQDAQALLEDLRP